MPGSATAPSVSSPSARGTHRIPTQSTTGRPRVYTVGGAARRIHRLPTGPRPRRGPGPKPPPRTHPVPPHPSRLSRPLDHRGVLHPRSAVRAGASPRVPARAHHLTRDSPGRRARPAGQLVKAGQRGQVLPPVAVRAAPRRRDPDQQPRGLPRHPDRLGQTTRRRTLEPAISDQRRQLDHRRSLTKTTSSGRHGWCDARTSRTPGTRRPITHSAQRRLVQPQHPRATGGYNRTEDHPRHQDDDSAVTGEIGKRAAAAPAVRHLAPRSTARQRHSQPRPGP